MVWKRRFMRAGAVLDVLSRPFMTIEVRHPGAGRSPLGADAVLLAANHRSVIDVIVALIACRRLGRPTRLVVGRSFFAKPGLGHILRGIGCIEGGRGSGADVVAIEAIRRGDTCAIMPEGAVRTMEPGRILAPLLPGVAAIWWQTGCAFHAVGISGAGDVWPDGRRLPPRPRRRGHRPQVLVRVTGAHHPGEQPNPLDVVTELMEANCVAADDDRRTPILSR